MLNYAFIFARGGSKGLPRKNIKLLSGKPLIQYSIEIAKNCPLIDKIFVSTEDLEIAQVAQELGAIVINRPSELASDTAAEWFAWQHAITWVNHHFGDFDHFVSLPVTSPLRSVQDIEKAILKKDQAKVDACISMTPASRSPFFNMVKQDSLGLISIADESLSKINRRQDAPTLFDITTVVYVLSPKFILNNAGLFDGKVAAIEIPKERAVDIDDIYDFKFAQVLMEEQLSSEK